MSGRRARGVGGRSGIRSMCLAARAVLATGAAVNPQFLYPTRVGSEDFELERTGAGHEFATDRHAPMRVVT